MKKSSKSTKAQIFKALRIQSHTSSSFSWHRHTNHLISPPPSRQPQEALPLLLLVVAVVILIVVSMVEMVVLVVVVMICPLRNR